MELQDEKKNGIESTTFDGQVTYEIINGPELGETPRKEEEEEEKKKKKKKKKKKEKKKKKASSLLWPVLGLGLICSLCVLFIFFPLGIHAPSTSSLKVKLQARGADTTAAPFFTGSAPYFNLHTLLAEHMRREAFHILCMHHLKLDKVRPYRACSIKSTTTTYHMVNPHIVQAYGKRLELTENSISCRVPVSTSRRRECIVAEWMDGGSGQFFNVTARFCGAPAVSLQLAMDEFSGNAHCNEEGS